jgi:hypothetical protein
MEEFSTVSTITKQDLQNYRNTSLKEFREKKRVKLWKRLRRYFTFWTLMLALTLPASHAAYA